MRSPQTLSEADRPAVAAWAADCAEHVLGIFEAAVQGDSRPRDLILLPAVGQDAHGPWGPGLLSSGLLGEIIGDLQAGVERACAANVHHR